MYWFLTHPQMLVILVKLVINYQLLIASRQHFISLKSVPCLKAHLFWFPLTIVPCTLCLLSVCLPPAPSLSVNVSYLLLCVVSAASGPSAGPAALEEVIYSELVRQALLPRSLRISRHVLSNYPARIRPSFYERARGTATSHGSAHHKFRLFSIKETQKQSHLPL